MVVPPGSLKGPGAPLALEIIQAALAMTGQQAAHLSRAYEADPNENYRAHCAVVQDALEFTGRGLTVGWFEAVFRYPDWAVRTKALHAVADAVVATLVADVIGSDVVDAMLRPWRNASPLSIAHLHAASSV